MKSIISLGILLLLCLSVFACQNRNRETELQISLKNKQIGNGTVFYGETNLPEGTKLGINLIENGKVCSQDFDIFVLEGKFNSGPFTSHGYPLSGTYNVELFTFFNKIWQTKNILVLLESYDSKNIITTGGTWWERIKNKPDNYSFCFKQFRTATIYKKERR